MSEAMMVRGEEVRLALADEAWVVVITKGGQERLVADRLKREGFEVYLPMRMACGPRKGSYPVAFFPRHLFVLATHDDDLWHKLFRTVGVTRVLCSPSAPVGLSGVFIHKIREREIQGFLPLGQPIDASPGKALSEYKRGEKVTTLGGYVDLIFDTSLDERRASLLASGMGDSGIRITTRLRK